MLPVFVLRWKQSLHVSLAEADDFTSRQALGAITSVQDQNGLLGQIESLLLFNGVQI